MSRDVADVANGGNGLILASQLHTFYSNYKTLHKALIHTLERGKLEDLTLDMFVYTIMKLLMDK